MISELFALRQVLAAPFWPGKPMISEPFRVILADETGLAAELAAPWITTDDLGAFR